jgi:cytochrome c oxidase subunit 4
VTGANVSEHPASAGRGGGHVLAPRTLIGTAAALGALTVLTVALGHVDMGPINVVVALAIASVKAILVALYFMHLRWGARFHLVVLAGAVVFAVLLASFVVFDTTAYQGGIAAARRAAELAAPAGRPPPD